MTQYSHGPLSTKKISTKEAQVILDNLVNKEIYLTCGYGGVMFVEIGNITDHHYEYEEGKETTRKYGDYRLFCDENWNFSNNKNINIDRWTSSSIETDELLESLAVGKLEKVEIIDNFKKTIFHISGGYKFTIVRDDSIDTFSLTMIPDKTKLTVFGNGDIELQDHEEEQWHLKKIKPRPKRSKTILVNRDFLRDQMPDVFPVSFERAIEFVQPILKQKIQAFEVSSGTCFSLEIGPDCFKIFSKKDQKMWPHPRYRWSLTISEVWVLKKDNKIILDVRKARFHFEEQLTKVLKNKQILKMSFDKNGNKTQIDFNDGHTLEVLENNRYTRWSVYDFLTGLSIESYRDQGLIYRFSLPIYLPNKYKTDDVHLDSILQELEFYRDYFGGKEMIV